MPFIYQAILARVDPDGKVQRVTFLASSEIFVEASNSLLDSISEQTPAVGDICSLVEQKLTQNFTDKEIKSITLSNNFDLHYQVNLENTFTTCFMCLTSKQSNLQNVNLLFDSMRSSYIEVEYIRDAIRDSSIHLLPQFQRFINKEIETLNTKMNGQKSARVDDIQKEVDSVKNIMHDNVVRVMERGERLDNLDQRAESLQQSSAMFQTSARRVQRNMCFKNLKWTIILGVVITLLIIIGLFAILKTANVI